MIRKMCHSAFMQQQFYVYLLTKGSVYNWAGYVHFRMSRYEVNVIFEYFIMNVAD